MAWLNSDVNLKISALKNAFETLISNKQLLKHAVNIEFAQSLLANQEENGCNIVEVFSDKINAVLHLQKKLNFIQSLKSKKYTHLFDLDVVFEIHIILNNKIPISALKHQFFNKLARYKTSDELLLALQTFKTKSIHWNREHYLNIIDEESLSVEVLNSSDNTLMIHVKNYEACSLLGSQAWCIVDSEKYFNEYNTDLNRQILYFNFNLPLESNESMIGFTIMPSGSIAYSHLKNDSETPYKIKCDFKFKKIDTIEVKNFIKENKFKDAMAFDFICQNGLIEFYDDYITNKKMTLSLTEWYALCLRSAQNGHIEILHKIIHQYNNNTEIWNKTIADTLHEVVKYGDINILNRLLNDKNIITNKDDIKTLINTAAANGHLEIVTHLLNYNTASLDIDKALTCSVIGGNLDIVKLFLKYDSADPSINDSRLLLYAVDSKSHNILEVLLNYENVIPSADSNTALKAAIRHNDTKSVKLLLNDPRLTIYADESLKLLICATFYNNLESLNLLLSDHRIDPAYNNNALLINSINMCSDKMLKRLLEDKRVDPSAMNNAALIENAREEITSNYDAIKKINLLLRDPRVLLKLNNKWVRKNILQRKQSIFFKIIKENSNYYKLYRKVILKIGILLNIKRTK